jgi:hypothetical protein
METVTKRKTCQIKDVLTKEKETATEYERIAEFMRAVGFYKVTEGTIENLVLKNNIKRDTNVFTYIYYYTLDEFFDGNFNFKGYGMSIDRRYKLIAEFLRSITNHYVTDVNIETLADKYSIAHGETYFTYIQNYVTEQLINAYIKNLQKNNRMKK